MNDRLPWWRGARGEWYVAAQLGLMILVFFGPRTAWGLLAWPAPIAHVCTFAGIALMLAGLTLLVAGGFRLGAHLTPLPYPSPHGPLHSAGAYGIVRHPMYGGGVILAYGWALLVHGWLTLAYASVLFAFLDFKSKREERWLVEKFPDYPEYRRRVRKLIPFVF